MLSLCHQLQRATGFAFDLLFLPLGVLGRLGSLSLLAVLTAVAMLWVYKRCSDQDAIRRHRQQVLGALLGVRLFPDDLGVFLRLQGRMLVAAGRYAGHSLRPTLVALVPLTLLLIQLDARFAERPLEVGEATLLTVQVRDAADLGGLSVHGTEAVAVETPRVRVPPLREAVWRLRAVQPGAHEVTVRLGEATWRKGVAVGGEGPVASLRSSRLADVLLRPGEAPLTSGPLVSIRVRHPPAAVDVLGWRVHWLVPFLGVTIAAGFALKGWLRVEL